MNHCRFKPFLKDLRLAKSRGLDLTLLEEVVNKLARQEVLEPNTTTMPYKAVFGTSENAISNRIGFWCIP